MSLTSRVQSLIAIRRLWARQQSRLLVQPCVWRPSPNRMVRHDQQAAGAATRWGIALWSVPLKSFTANFTLPARSRKVEKHEAMQTQVMCHLAAESTFLALTQSRLRTSPATSLNKRDTKQSWAFAVFFGCVAAVLLTSLLANPAYFVVKHTLRSHFEYALMFSKLVKTLRSMMTLQPQNANLWAHRHWDKAQCSTRTGNSSWPFELDPSAKGCSNQVAMSVVCEDVNQDIPNWKSYLMEKLVGASTLPVDFYFKVKQHAGWHRVRLTSTPVRKLGMTI